MTKVSIYLLMLKWPRTSEKENRSFTQTNVNPIRKTYTIHWLCLKKIPEQIAIYLKRKYRGFCVSHETIYQFIYRFQMSWAKFLIRKHEPRWRKRMGKKHCRREMIPGRVWVSGRPEVVNAKFEIGHWEGDSIVCSQSLESLNVMVERQSLYVTVRKIRDRKPGMTRDMMIKTLSSFRKRSRKSITLDNGIEFKYHEEVKKALKLVTYFCHPYHSWEKGLVENTNG